MVWAFSTFRSSRMSLEAPALLSAATWRGMQPNWDKYARAGHVSLRMPQHQCLFPCFLTQNRVYCASCHAN